MAKLYVVGDSFSSTELGYRGLLDSSGPTPDYDYGASVYWPKKLADRLGVELVNGSLLGSSQDYSINQLLHWCDSITPNDYIVFVLTESLRFWMLERSPEVTRFEIMKQFPTVYSPERIKACELFSGFINRPQLADIQMKGRLALLAHLTKTRKWRKPIVVSAFDDLTKLPQYPDLIYSKGTLTYDVSYEEIKVKATTSEYVQFIKGLDPRYNHMCLSNHNILINKLINSFNTGDLVDLTTGFKKEILNKETLKDLMFQATELSPGALKWRAEAFKKNANLFLKSFK
jgi:hypothetical protein